MVVWEYNEEKSSFMKDMFFNGITVVLHLYIFYTSLDLIANEIKHWYITIFDRSNLN